MLKGHVRPEAVAANDQGRVDASLRLRHVTLLFQPSAAQQAELSGLLERQQDPASPDYHHWLTPDEYAARFGASQSQIDKVTAWLRGQNLSVDSVARGHTTVAFSGGVRDVERAFATEIHHYAARGETHFANATEPSVPATLSGFIRVVHGLDDFRLKPLGLKSNALKPMYTASSGQTHYLSPGDLATMFGIAPLYNSGITGKGQTIVVVGQTQINMSDIEQYRTYFNLSANDPQTMLVPNTQDPGISKDDLAEADLDLEWSGAIARDASIVFVYSSDVTDAVEYAINQNLAPVISMSYGLCEGLSENADLTSMSALAQQANAQGITWMAASGDSGANDCYGESNRPPSGLSVDAPASLPNVTGVGGTTLNEGSATYWNTSNDANHASALSYIPEVVWNDSALDKVPSSSGGGASTVFAKPPWQTGTGVPNDGARDVPDIALPGSADHDAYLVYTGGSFQMFGGTSAGAPVFSGMVSLLNQYLTANGLQTVPGLGNVNPRLYALAQSAPAAFHDVTAGNNMVDSCSTKSRNCVVSQVGFNAGVGYDQATGLGSVDACNLITSWSTSNPAGVAAPVIGGLTSAASYVPVYSPGMIMTVFGQNLAACTSTPATLPLPTAYGGVTVTIDGIAAPLYYVSPTQINLQIPYEIPANSVATLRITSMGQTASGQISLASAAPGIFGDTNRFLAGAATAARSQTIALYETGDGLFTPPLVTTGAVPRTMVSISVNRPGVSVTVGGIAAAITFIGVPAWSIGDTQINFTVPANAPLGQQPVIVTVNGVASAAAYVFVGTTI